MSLTYLGETINEEVLEVCLFIVETNGKIKMETGKAGVWFSWAAAGALLTGVIFAMSLAYAALLQEVWRIEYSTNYRLDKIEAIVTRIENKLDKMDARVIKLEVESRK